MKQDFDKTIRIPVITDVVRSGNPDIVDASKSSDSQRQRRQVFEQRLKERIAELQAATGQDEYSGLARAHAIRSESGQQQQADNSLHPEIDPSVEKNMDAARDELLKELSSLLK